jgi:hypothetical protein
MTSKRAFLLILGAAVLWYLRALQVFLFTVAAGTRKWVSADQRMPNDVVAWASIPPPMPLPGTTSRCFLTFHPWYAGFDAARVCRCLAEIRSLGAGGLRTDVRWKDLLPDGKQVDLSAVAWHRSFLRVARDWYGLRILLVLSDPPSPALRMSEKDRLAEWRHYVEIVMEHFGDLCESYQVMNEINNPVYRFVGRRNVPDAIRSAADIIRRRVPKAQISINVLCDLWHWRQELGWYLGELPGVIDIIGLDFYPDTWAISWRNPWSTLDQDLRDLIRGANAGTHPRVAIMETGYSTNIPYIRGEQQQASFYRRLTELLRKADTLGQGRSLAFIALYELCDDGTNAPVDPEAHFGIVMMQPWRRKLAFNEVKRLCESFT